MIFISIFKITLFLIIAIKILFVFFNIDNRKKLGIKGFVSNYLIYFLFFLILVWTQIYVKAIDNNLSWDSSNFHSVFPLSGSNVEIVPSREKGYIIDSSNKFVREGNIISFEVNFLSSKVKNGAVFYTSIYCFVSDDFNGNSVGIKTKIDSLTTNESLFQLFDSKNVDSKYRKNLIDNGDFSLGATNWKIEANSTSTMLIETPFGRGIRVIRGDGDGVDWSLRYNGRPIIYYTGHEYETKFLFKVQKGVDIPFAIGWWAPISNPAYSLPLKIKKLENKWNEARCSLRFKETSYNPNTFLNSLKDSTVVDIANVEITDLNLDDSLPLFMDQLSQKGRWQKLSIETKCKEGLLNLSLKISKEITIDSASLKGYVIFLRPNYKITN